MNSFELNKELNRFNKKVTEIVEYSKDVKLDDDEKNIINDLKKINIELEGNERYYNDNVVIYNGTHKVNFTVNIFGPSEVNIEREGTSNVLANEREGDKVTVLAPVTG